ncbi:MAG: site-specific integrase [Williamsia sp.]|nr:site-specific integrase [Williamsia sp.]
MRLELKHINTAQAKVFVKGTKRTAERWLELQAVQISQLQTYLSKSKFKEGPLLLTGISEKNISNRMQHMMRQLRKLNPKLINAQQIRSSVITHWLKTHNLRQVQYMAGHKYVSSTQRYQVSNLDELQNQLQQHHPMK